MHIFVHEDYQLYRDLLYSLDKTKESATSQILIFSFEKFDSISEASGGILRFTERGTQVLQSIQGKEGRFSFPDKLSLTWLGCVQKTACVRNELKLYFICLNSL